MTSEERHGTLADAAAAWVPPWDRPSASAATAAGEADTLMGEPEAAPTTDEPAPEETPVDQPLVEQPPATETPEGERPTGEMPDGGSLPAPAEVEPGTPVDVPAEQNPEPQAAVERAYRDQALFDVAGAHLDDATLRGALEAILMVVDEPVSDVVLAQVLEQPTGRVAATLERIAADFTAAGHGFELRRAAGGWRLYTRPQYAAYVERFVLDGQSVRLTQAALETLAVVAYKQPVTRSRVAAVRGVNSDGVIRTLVSRGLIEECGTEPESGAFLYRTSRLFLEKLGLDSVDDLPPLAPFLPDDVEGLADATR
ncbi:MAG TPA: SMC-Scp complex subunit ScpB [Micromonosporaceae bacterium]|nr:SMC-Scp complex subunit ScpB [Micromonosporaceae bacterium]